jgi:hypothetical protein
MRTRVHRTLLRDQGYGAAGLDHVPQSSVRCAHKGCYVIKGLLRDQGYGAVGLDHVASSSCCARVRTTNTH